MKINTPTNLGSDQENECKFNHMKIDPDPTVRHYNDWMNPKSEPEADADA
jgi:hypothetical protein